MNLLLQAKRDCNPESITAPSLEKQVNVDRVAHHLCIVFILLAQIVTGLGHRLIDFKGSEPSLHSPQGLVQ